MGKSYTTEKIKEFPIEKYLDKQKDIKIIIDKNENADIVYEIFAPNIQSPKLLQNLKNLTNSTYNVENNKLSGMLEQKDNADNLFRLAIGKLGMLELDLENNAISIPRIPVSLKTLMAQKDNLEFGELNYFDREEGIKTDLHSHYTAMLEPEKLLALGLKHNVNYHVFYVYALGLELTPSQQRKVNDAVRGKFEGDKGEEILKMLHDNKGNYQRINDIFEEYEAEGMKKLAIPLSNIVTGKHPEMKAENVRKILNSCSLPREAQSTFSDMTDTYNNRYPFTNGNGKGYNQLTYNRVMESESIPNDIKAIFTQMCEDRDNPDFSDNDLQDDMILWIGRNAREEGIDYIEMSHNALSSKNNKRTLATYDKIVDKVERETGTKLRFLAGVSRTTDEDKYEEIEGHIKESLRSKYVVGFDILGEEINSTEEISQLIENMTDYALEQDPDMVIRVHAGETNSFEANVLNTIKAVYGRYAEKLIELKELGKTLNIKKPNLRIGHGIYGLEEEMKAIGNDTQMLEIIQKLIDTGMYNLDGKSIEETTLLDFMAQMNTVIIERCMSSNILLSHQNALGKDPIRTYINHGIKCVLGTDGYGVYGTSSQEEVLFATTEGIDEDYIDKIREAEEYAIERSNDREKYIEEKEQNEEIIYTESQKGNNSKPPIKGDCVISHFPENKKAVVIAGGSYNRYDREGNYIVSEVTQDDEIILSQLIEKVDPENTIFVIGGKIQGQEKRLVELINQENEKRRQNGKTEFSIILVTQEFEKLAEQQKKLIKESNIEVIESHEKRELANYRKINSDIFSQDIDADLIVLDGAQAAENLMTSANKGKENHIFSKENINDYIRDKFSILDESKVTLLSKEDILLFAKDSTIQDMNDDMQEEIDKMGIDHSLELVVEGQSLDD